MTAWPKCVRRPTGHYPVCQRASPFLTVYTIAAIGYVQIKDKTGGTSCSLEKDPFSTERAVT